MRLSGKYYYNRDDRDRDKCMIREALALPDRPSELSGLCAMPSRTSKNRKNHLKIRCGLSPKNKSYHLCNTKTMPEIMERYDVIVLVHFVQPLAEHGQWNVKLIDETAINKHGLH